MESKQIIINESIISYTTAGRGDHSLIFLHGWRSNKEAWLPVAHLMEQSGYRLIFIDLPGFGASEAPKQPHTLHDYAETVRLFREKLDMKVHAVIGHSAGARIAAKLAAEHPDFMEKLVLVASGGARPTFVGIKATLAKIAKPFFAPRFMTPLRKKLYAWIGAEDYLATPELQKTFVNIINENLDPLLAQIKTDTLVIWGDKDETAPITYGTHITKLIPNAQLEIIEGAGHYCFSEQPEEFVNLISKFIAS
ncbi:MAG: alpha/beta hydrolase [Candidatus Pacebacteria bacterium]|nr:alpha/beta hydrolase [Candidatus Paceibacterota bacterium]